MEHMSRFTSGGRGLILLHACFDKHAIIRLEGVVQRLAHIALPSSKLRQDRITEKARNDEDRPLVVQ